MRDVSLIRSLLWHVYFLPAPSKKDSISGVMVSECSINNPWAAFSTGRVVSLHGPFSKIAFGIEIQ